jgi:hypothetical protein
MTPHKPVKKPAAVISASAVYSWSELCRRLRWKEHSARQARINGLRLIRFGREKFCLGSDVLRFFELLAERQEAKTDSRSNHGGGE